MKGTLGRLVGVFEVMFVCCKLFFFWSSNVNILCGMFVNENMVMFFPTEPREETQNLRLCSYCNGGAGGLGGLGQHW